MIENGIPVNSVELTEGSNNHKHTDKEKEVPHKEASDEEFLSRLTIGEKLTNSQRRRLKRIIKEFKNNFSDKLLPKFPPVTRHHIQLKEGVNPIRRKYKFVHPDHAKVIDEMVKDLLNRQIIKEEISPWSAPILCVPKPSGGIRVVIDMRGLNENTIGDAYIQPLVEETIASMKGAKYFTKMDLTEAFWQVKLDKESSLLTGFGVRGKSYVWKRMPMGIKNSAATFQRVIDEVLGELKHICIANYIDDCVIYSRTFEQHVEHIKLVLDKLKNAVGWLVTIENL